MIRRAPICVAPQPEIRFTITSPVLPELVTECDTLEEAFTNCLRCAHGSLEIYSEQVRRLPMEIP